MSAFFIRTEILDHKTKTTRHEMHIVAVGKVVAVSKIMFNKIIDTKTITIIVRAIIGIQILTVDTNTITGTTIGIGIKAQIITFKIEAVVAMDTMYIIHRKTKWFSIL